MPRTSVTRSPRREPIKPVNYAPRAGYGLDLEILSAAALRRRARTLDLKPLERIEFHLLICVTGGQCRHIVDFETHACTPGSLLILRPGQVQRYDERFAWDGWLLLFRPEILQPREVAIPLGELERFRQVEALPTHLRTTPSDRQVIAQALQRMDSDSRLAAPAPALNALLRSELHALLTRLHIIQTRAAGEDPVAPITLQRFWRYRTLVEREFRRWHSVAPYARVLGCSDKTLGRAAMDAVGVSAKALLVARIVLEARRMLAHTSRPVASVADQLGFDEATNFVKFFRRETGMTPGEFRAQQATP